MKLVEIKQKMKDYRDFYGGDLLDVDQIDGAKNKNELKKIINRHHQYLDSMLADAESHLRKFEHELFYPPHPLTKQKNHANRNSNTRSL